MAQVADSFNLGAMSQVIQKTWPFGISKSANEKDKIFLKAYLSNNMYTVIQAARSNTVQEAINMVAEKKNIPLVGYNVKIVTATREVDVIDVHRPLSDFDPIGLILYKTDGGLENDTNPPMRAGRRGSVVVAPKETTIRDASQEFPKTVLDQAEAALHGRRTPEYTTSASSRRRPSRRLSTFIFRREREYSDDSSTSDDSQDGKSETDSFDRKKSNSVPIDPLRDLTTESTTTELSCTPFSPHLIAKGPSLPEPRKRSMSLTMKNFRRERKHTDDSSMSEDSQDGKSHLQKSRKNSLPDPSPPLPKSKSDPSDHNRNLNSAAKFNSDNTKSSSSVSPPLPIAGTPLLEPRKRSMSLTMKTFRTDRKLSHNNTISQNSQDGPQDQRKYSLPRSFRRSTWIPTENRTPESDTTGSSSTSSAPPIAESTLPEPRKRSMTFSSMFRRDRKKSQEKIPEQIISKPQDAGHHQEIRRNGLSLAHDPDPILFESKKNMRKSSVSTPPPRTSSKFSLPDPNAEPPLPDPNAESPPLSDSSAEPPLPDPNAESPPPDSNTEPPLPDPDADVDSAEFKSKQRARPPLLRSETATSVATLNRKRTYSNPSSPINPNATLRRNTFRTRSRAQSEAPMPIDLESSCSRSIRVTYPDGSVSAYKMPQNSTMESILKFSLDHGNLDMVRYTFESLEPKMPIEMDRNLHFYLEKNVTCFVIVEREKEFSLKWVAEGDQDTMVLQMVGGEWLVMAATEQKLIERMTDGETPDLTFIDTLLLTYRSFMSPAEFFDQLVCRFNAELPPDPTPEDIEYFEKMKGSTQERCMTVFGWWIEYHIQDFTHNDQLREELRQVLLEISEYPWFENRAQDMTRILDIKTKEYEAIYDHILRSQVQRKGKTMDSSLVQDLSAQELAQQLCIHDFQLFRNIPAIEYLNQIWRRPNDEELLTCPSLDYFIARFDKESYWVATEVCCVKDKKKRIQVLEKFIMTAKLCQTYGNFFTMFALIAGLSLSSVSRLKKSFEGLSKTAKATVEELEKLADPSKNMKNYRDCLAKTNPPIVPFLPIYLKDLTFINDGNESKIFTNMINFDKLRMMARRVHDITDMTKVQYIFSPKPIVQNYLNKPSIEKDSQKLKEMSLDCEPKK